MKKRNERSALPMTVVLTSSGNQSLVASGALGASANTLNIADGQLGVLSEDPAGTIAQSNFISAGTTAANVRSIRVIRGTPMSSNLAGVDPFGIQDPAYVKSAVIDADSILTITTRTPEIGTYSANYFTSFGTPTAGDDYTLQIELESVNREIYYAPQRRENVVVNVTAQNPAPAQPADYVLQNLALRANQQSIWYTPSGKPFVVLGINTSGNPGTVINNINEGTSIPFMTLNGTTYNLTASLDLVNTLIGMRAANTIAGTESIVNLGSVTPGTAATVDALLVIGLDDETALIFDEETRNKVQIDAGVSLANTRTFASRGKDWVGTGRQWRQYWKRYHAQQYGLTNYVGHPYEGDLDTVKSYIDNSDSTLYTSTTVLFRKRETAETTFEQRIEHQLVILVPAQIDNRSTTVDGHFNGAPATPLGTSTADAATVTSLNSILGAWLDSALTYSQFEYRGQAANGGIFV